jgi:ankyrin repeat protein
MKHDPEFFEAIKDGDTVKVEAMLKHNPKLANARNEGGISALLFAAYYGKVDVRDVILHNGATVDIFEACAVGAREKVMTLLAQDPKQLKSYSHDGWTPLHLAAFFGYLDLARFLLDAGADIDALSKNGQELTPLHSALANPHHAKVGLMLIEKGADTTLAQSEGYTPLHYAAANGMDDVVIHLLAMNSTRSARTKDGKTPQDLARERKHHTTAKILS